MLVTETLSQRLNNQYAHEDKFVRWSTGPGKTEHDRCEHASRMVKDAIKECEALRPYKPVVFVKGSFRHRTNIASDSDIDVGVRSDEIFWSEYLPGTDAQTYGYGKSTTLSWNAFKDLVEQALVRKFGAKAVVRGDKAIKISENTYRIQADVVPCLQYRKHITVPDHNREFRYEEGTQFVSDAGKTIVNWPDQDLENGENKNTTTNRRFKRVVRILKNLRNEMRNNSSFKDNVPSFLIECLVYNVPNLKFNNETYTQDVKNALNYLRLLDESSFANLIEVNELKTLFGTHQKWTTHLAIAFVNACHAYLRFP